MGWKNATCSGLRPFTLFAATSTIHNPRTLFAECADYEIARVPTPPSLQQGGYSRIATEWVGEDFDLQDIMDEKPTNPFVDAPKPRGRSQSFGCMFPRRGLGLAAATQFFIQDFAYRYTYAYVYIYTHMNIYYI